MARSDCDYYLDGQKLTFQKFRQRVLESKDLFDKYVSKTPDKALSPVSAADVSPFDRPTVQDLKVTPGTPVGTRNPTAKKATERGTDPNALIDLASARRDEGSYKKNAMLLANYPHLAGVVPEITKRMREIDAPFEAAKSKLAESRATLADLKAQLQIAIANESGQAKSSVKADLVKYVIETGETGVAKIEALVKKIRATQEKVAAQDKAATEAGKKATAQMDAFIDKGEISMEDADRIYDALVSVTESNLEALIELFPKDLRETAKLWYDGANKIAQHYAAVYGTTLNRSAAVLAVFSPQKDWFMNVALAERAMEVWSTQKRTKWSKEMSQRYLFRAGDPAPALDKEGNEKVDADGNTIYEKGAVPIFDEDGEIVGWLNWKDDAAAEKRAEAEEYLRGVEGKSLSQLAPEDQARFIRMYSEVHHDASFPVIAPNGKFMGPKMNQEGTKKVRLAWGGYNTIEKAIAILSADEANEMGAISEALGTQHKVRSFYNNIADPNNTSGHVTMDTHAIAALLWQGLSGGSIEVTQNFGGARTASNSLLGVNGLYPAFAQAYRKAAERIKNAEGNYYLPREIQSITWEAVRLLFPAKWKSNRNNVKAVRELWNDYERGNATIEETRDAIFRLVKGKSIAEATADGTGVGRPDWAENTGDGQNNDAAGETDDAGKLPFVGGDVGLRSGRAAGERGASGAATGVVRGSASGVESRTLLKEAASGRLQSPILTAPQTEMVSARAIVTSFFDGAERQAARQAQNPDPEYRRAKLSGNEAFYVEERRQKIADLVLEKAEDGQDVPDKTSYFYPEYKSLSSKAGRARIQSLLPDTARRLLLGEGWFKSEGYRWPNLYREITGQEPPAAPAATTESGIPDSQGQTLRSPASAKDLESKQNYGKAIREHYASLANQGRDPVTGGATGIGGRLEASSRRAGIPARGADFPESVHRRDAKTAELLTRGIQEVRRVVRTGERPDNDPAVRQLVSKLIIQYLGGKAPANFAESLAHMALGGVLDPVTDQIRPLPRWDGQGGLAEKMGLEQVAEGISSTVYLDKGNQTIYKRVAMGSGVAAGPIPGVMRADKKGKLLEHTQEWGLTLFDILESISANNRLKSALYTEIVGVTEEGDLILKQAHVKGLKPVKALAVEPINATGMSFVYSTTTNPEAIGVTEDGEWVYSTDLHGKNVMVDRKGNTYIIDTLSTRRLTDAEVKLVLTYADKPAEIQDAAAEAKKRKSAKLRSPLSEVLDEAVAESRGAQNDGPVSSNAAVSAEEDAKYMRLAKDPVANREELQRMVDAAAKAAGYNIGPVFHWSNSPELFHEFSLNHAEEGFHFGTQRAAEERAWDTAGQRAEGWGRMYRVYLKGTPRTVVDQSNNRADNWMMNFPQLLGPRSSEGDPSPWAVVMRAGEKVDLKKTWIAKNLLDEYRENIAKVEAALGRPLEHPLVELDRLLGPEWKVFQYENTVEHKGSDSYVAVHSNQVKLADPVTYDGNGNVIPLSQRFNESEPDIRYSPPSATSTPLAAAVDAAAEKGPTEGRPYSTLPMPKAEPVLTKALRQAKEGMPEIVRAALEGKVQIPDVRVADLAAAESYLESMVGTGVSIEDAANLVNSPAYGGHLSAQQVIVVKALAVRRIQNAWGELDKLIKAGKASASDILLADHYKAVSDPLIKEVSEALTQGAKITNLGNLIARLFNPRALVPIGYKWPITKKQTEIIGKDKDGSAIIKAVGEAKNDAAKTTRSRTAKIISAVADKILGEKEAKEVKRAAEAMAATDAPLTEQIKAAVVAIEVRRALEAATGAAGVESISESLYADVRRQVAAQLDRWLQDYGPEEAPGAPPSDKVVAARFRDIWERSRLADDAFKRAVKLLSEKSPTMAAKLEGAKFDIAKDGAARGAVRQLVQFSEEAYKSLAQKHATKERLVALAQATLGGTIDKASLEDIADAISSVYDEELRAATERRLDALKASNARVSKILDTTITDQLVKASNLGALSEEETYNILAPKFNLPAWDAETAAKIDAALQDVQRLPEDSLPREEALIRIMSEIARAHRESAKGLEKVSHTAEVLSSFWTAGVLSGPPTHLVNATMTNVSVFLESMAQATGYFFASKKAGATTAEALKFYGDLGRSISNIFKNGSAFDNKIGINVKAAMNYGVTQFKSEKGENLSVLENWVWKENPKTLKEAWNNVLSMYKYVGRAMLAADVANSVIANDASLLMRARFEAMETGLTGKALDEHIDKVLDTTGAIREKATKQAKEEFARGDFDLALPFGHRSKPMPAKLMLARRVEQLVERETYGAEEIAAARRFAEKVTFNSDAEGLIGMMADLLGQITNKIGITKPLLPFPRTLSNIVNQAINYTPYGFARAANFSFSGVLASRYHKESTRGLEFQKYLHPEIDKFSPDYYAQLGRASAGTAALVALLGLAMKGLDDEKEKGERAFFEVTAQGPENYAHRKQLQASGVWEPNTVRIGGIRLRYTDWPALGLVLAAVGSYSDAIRYNKIDEKSASEQFLLSFMGISSAVFEKQMLSGMSDLFKVIGGGPEGVSSAKRLSSSYVGGFTNPQLLRWVRASFDSTPPEQSTVSGWLLSLAPMAIGNDRPSLNILGQPIERMFFEPTTQRFADISEIVSPHPVLAPLSKAGLFLPAAKNTKLTDPNTMRPRAMSGDEFYEYAEVYGKTVARFVSPQVAESLAKMPQEAAQRFLDDSVRPAARDAASIAIMQKWARK